MSTISMIVSLGYWSDNCSASSTRTIRTVGRLHHSFRILHNKGRRFYWLCCGLFFSSASETHISTFESTSTQHYNDAFH